MPLHQWGYQFGILHHGCFIELCPSHQSSTESFGVPEATVAICSTSKNMTDQTGKTGEAIVTKYRPQEPGYRVK